MSTAQNVRVLILSATPVPTPEHLVVQGDGLRCWGLATGLRGHGLTVTVAVDPAHPQSLCEHEGVLLTNWNLTNGFGQLLAAADVVIVSYCAGELSRRVVDTVAVGTLLVLDAYVPIFTEVAARQSADVVAEYGPFLRDAQEWRRVLARGDLLLCAHQAQFDYYTGVLSSLAVINPFTFSQQRILLVPFGLRDVDPRDVSGSGSPYPPLGVKDNDFVLLWFGALYPWFDIAPLLAAVEELVRCDRRVHFVVVGGRNPNVNHDDFVRHAEHVRRWARGMPDSVHVVDWVEYEQRTRWLANADLVVSLNRATPEVRYSWRTRVLDYIAVCVPLLTNGGDPLSEMVISAGGGLATDGSAVDLVRQVRRCIDDREVLSVAALGMRNLRPTLDWGRVTEPLARAASAGARPTRAECEFAAEHHLPRRIRPHRGTQRLRVRASQLTAIALDEGVRGSAAVVRDRTVTAIKAAAARARGYH